MRVLTKKRLREFWEKHPQAEQPLKRWHDYVRKAEWSSPADVKRDYHTADILPDNRVVFNIGGNKFRLVARVLFSCHKVFILRVLTHEQYDREPWQTDCGCYQPPPKLSKPRQRPLGKRRRR